MQFHICASLDRKQSKHLNFGYVSLAFVWHVAQIVLVLLSLRNWDLVNQIEGGTKTIPHI